MIERLLVFFQWSPLVLYLLSDIAPLRQRVMCIFSNFVEIIRSLVKHNFVHLFCFVKQQILCLTTENKPDYFLYR